jgi:hypothetical protein
MRIFFFFFFEIYIGDQYFTNVVGANSEELVSKKIDSKLWDLVSEVFYYFF